MATILLLSGPNLNLLGTREPGVYGATTLAQIDETLVSEGAAAGVRVQTFQSNHEGAIVDWIQEASAGNAVGIVLNPAGYTTTSVAILDAIFAARCPVIEVHISNIHAREEFRHHSYISKGAKAVICGLGIAGYALAIDGIAALSAAKN